MPAPTKKLEELVLSQKPRHAGNPVLRWMAGNVAIEQDAADNWKPSKKKSQERIDGIVALVMAIDLATRHVERSSIYEERGGCFCETLHGARSFCREAFEQVGGCPFIQSGQDQGFLRRLEGAKMLCSNPALSHESKCTPIR